MPKSTGATGRGFSCLIGNGGSPEVFIPVANVTTINLTGRDVEEIDFTHLLSEGGFREYRPGFKDAGSLGLECQFSPVETSHTLLQQEWLDGSLFTTRVDMSPLGMNWNTYLEGEGFVKNPSDITINVTDPDRKSVV